jgi:hypothetical protein
VSNRLSSIAQFHYKFAYNFGRSYCTEEEQKHIIDYINNSKDKAIYNRKVRYNKEYGAIEIIDN